MTLQSLQEFLCTLHEPAIAVTVEGGVEASNDAFKNVLRHYGREDATRIHDIVVDEPDEVDAFLKSCARTRPAIQGSLTIVNGGRSDKFSCFGGLLRPASNRMAALILLRFYRSQEAVRRFQLLGRKIDELNAEVRRRKMVEAELRDIQKSLEDRVAERTADLELANRELLRSNKALEEFAYVASHDLREPLRKISVFSEMLATEAEDELSEENRGLLLRMISAAQRMDALVESLLEFSRVSTSAEPFSDVDLNQVVRDVVSDLEVLVKQTGAAIEVHDLPEVRADEAQMRQLFQNLISNSLKFRRPNRKPVVEISARYNDASAEEEHVIQHRDNGIGFEAEFADQIFDPFRRLNPRHEFEGTGIGLAVCRRIVERHGGSISAEGRPGEGATFTITFPASGR